MKWNAEKFEITELGALAKISLVLGLLGLAASGYGFTIDKGQLMHSYLTSFMFWISIALGGLFFVLVNYLANARWSVVTRKISESIMCSFPLLLILFIPILFSIHELYHWSHEEAVATDLILQTKTSYLNTPFFIIRSVGYFVIWIILTILLGNKSMSNEKKADPHYYKKVRKISAPGMILFAITITFASFDWLMSLDPHWFSTIFGVYLFSGSFLAFLCFFVLIGKYLASQGILKDIITVEHYHDVGKLMFGFIIFWSYMAFSQYFLIWYANIPEETYWFLKRWEGSWVTMSMVLLFGHFVIPFILMLTRWSKRNTFMLVFMALWILAMRWVDLYWLIFPTHSESGVYLSWMDLSTMVGIGGVFVWFVMFRMTKDKLIPLNDPDLGTSLHHVN